MLYHVRISQKSNRAHDETWVDLTEEELLERFVRPYESGEPIIINGKTVGLDDLERIRISRSEAPAGSFIPTLKAEDQASPVVFIGGPSYDWRAADRADDVTDDYIKGPPGHKRGEAPAHVPKKTLSGNNQIFIVHGHDHALKNDLEVFLREIAMEPIVLHRQPDEGLTIVEKFEKYADVSYAIILTTPDDIAFPATQAEVPESERHYGFRARQNTIFEWGYFIGKLGRGRVCCIYKRGVELPSDLGGLLYKEVDAAISEVGYELIRELKKAGFRPRL